MVRVQQRYGGQVANVQRAGLVTRQLQAVAHMLQQACRARWQVRAPAQQ
jgi:hypothetical protein